MTNCLEILMQIRNRVPDFVIKESHYTASSIVAEIGFGDQDYTIEIKPMVKSCQHRTCVSIGSERLCVECGRNV